jgi:predicted nucleotidyltransferase
MSVIFKHESRDLRLPELRKVLLDTIVRSLKVNSDVMALFLGGSLARGNADIFSDIDLRIVVNEAKYKEYIQRKQMLARDWGKVLFFEDMNPNAPYTIAHYDFFIKVDVFFYTASQLQPSIWLKEISSLYDPEGIVSEVRSQSQQIQYVVTAQEVKQWRGKIFAYLHEIYRRVRREEYYYALGQMNNLRAFVVNGWNMEMDRHSNDVWDWSKVEGQRTELNQVQLSLLESWSCGRNQAEIMETMITMIPEITRLHQVLCNKTGLEKNMSVFNKVLELIV